MKQFFVN